MDLKYLFSVWYIDGFEFNQTPEDKSLKHKGKSCYTDALEFEKEHGKMIAFALENEDRFIAVDLLSGIFNVDGKDVILGRDTPENGEFRPIFFREHHHKFNAQMEEQDHTVTYYLGWQTTIDGKNYQEMMGVK